MSIYFLDKLALKVESVHVNPCRRNPESNPQGHLTPHIQLKQASWALEMPNSAARSLAPKCSCNSMVLEPHHPSIDLAAEVCAKEVLNNIFEVKGLLPKVARVEGSDPNLRPFGSFLS